MALCQALGAISPLAGEVGSHRQMRSGRGVAASGLPEWTRHPNPLPQGERELTAVADGGRIASPDAIRERGDRTGTARVDPSPQPSFALGLALDTENLDMIQAWDEDSP